MYHAIMRYLEIDEDDDDIAYDPTIVVRKAHALSNAEINTIKEAIQRLVNTSPELASVFS